MTDEKDKKKPSLTPAVLSGSILGTNNTLHNFGLGGGAGATPADYSAMRERMEEEVKREAEKEKALQARFQKLETQLDRIEKLFSKEEIEGFKKEIKEYYSDLLVDKKDEEGKDILSIKTDVNKYIKNQEDTFKQLEGIIRGLLPGAGAAGLASTYLNAKKRYGVVSVHEMSDDGKENFWHVVTTGFKTLLFYSMFIVPLVAIVLMFGDVIDKLGNSQSNIYSLLLIRFFIATPLAGISWFGLYSIRVNRQLYEEYNHKQRVMELYHSFSDVLEEYNAEEYAKNLLGIMMETVNAKPSLDLRKDKIKKEKGGEPAPKPQDITNN